MSNIITARDIEIVTAEINIITEQTQRHLLSGAIEIGRRLVEAKAMVPHGEWGKYLQERVNYSQSSANNLMKLYQEYGDNQTSLFNDFANSQAFQNLTYTKALAMLALPAEMRQSFAEEHDVANKSTREVQAEVQAELEAMKAENEKLSASLEEACENNDTLRQRLEDSRAASEGLKETADSYAKDLVKAQETSAAAAEQVEKLTKQLENAKQKEQKAKDALKQAKEHPEIPEALMEEMRQQVAADAAAKATEDLQKQLAAAQEQAEAAAKAKQVAEDQAAELEKQLRLASPNMVLLGNHLTAAQESFAKLLDVLRLVVEEDPEKGAKLKDSIREKLLGKLAEDLEGI